MREEAKSGVMTKGPSIILFLKQPDGHSRWGCGKLKSRFLYAICFAVVFTDSELTARNVRRLLNTVASGCCVANARL